MNTEYYDKIWRNLHLKDLHIQQIFWDSRADGFNKSVFKEKNIKKTNNLLKLLTEKGALNKEGEVLDIGCGPGKYSLEFSKSTKKVTAIDISPEMIKYAKDNVKRENINNISFENIPWEKVNIEEKGWEKKFDLVFASMCPGINNKDTLMKMVQATKTHCFMSSFASRKDKIMDTLYKEVYNEEPSSRWGKNIYCAYNILWNLGFYPEISYEDVKREKVYELEKAIELYTLQIQKKKEDSNSIKNKVTEYLTNINQNGSIKDTMEAKIAWIYWRV